ncbi:hypothetical protein AXG93_2886s1210 [Marchantia polymorpha subsp. ruderalis]|uniref:Uncharacterized protein n=1 Tax=Marchantia polymorpha subsp. ruderalis TaxID=1480154 RepID=A0A176WMS9_MARPO|nr:hypothetical protein AXG93_2886s1210 [Marchantia polymorpha subsp. ruderalis]
MRLRSKQKEARSAQTPPEEMSLRTQEANATDAFVSGLAFGGSPSAEAERTKKSAEDVSSPQAPSAVANRAGEAGPLEVRSPTALEILAGSGAARRRSHATQFLGIVEDFCGDGDPRLRGRVEFGRAGSGVGARHADRSVVQTGGTTIAKAVLQLRDDATAKAQRDFEKQRATIEAELHSERIQNSTLAEELVRQTRLLEQRQIARKADEELLRRLQSL